MSITRVNFSTVANGGDTPTAALVKLDASVFDLDTRKLDKTGGALTGDLSLTGNLTLSGTGSNGTITCQKVASRADVTAGQNFVSTSATAVLAATGAAAQVIVRPNGASTAGQSTFAASGAVSLGGGLTVNGSTQSTGYATRNGTGGAYAGNNYNILWTSVASLWIDNTSVGTFQFATSDPRIKHSVTYLDSPEDGDADIEKVLAARPCTWYYKDIGIFKDDGQLRRSFLSPEMQDIDPLLAPGDRDALTEDGGIVPLNLNPDTMISVLWGALRREIGLRRALEDRIAALEAGQ